MLTIMKRLVFIDMSDGLELSLIIRLIFAAIFGGIIGLERESRRHPAGLRTHILVSTGSCLIMVLSMYVFRSFSNVDPSRLAAQVVSGIGFLGAGTIIREGANIKGLTTAASLWVVSAIGLAVGGNFYILAFVTTVLSWITLTFLDILEKRVISPESLKLEITLSDDKKEELENFCTALENCGYTIKNFVFLQATENNEAILELTIDIRNFQMHKLLAKISQMSCIKSIKLKGKE